MYSLKQVVFMCSLESLYSTRTLGKTEEGDSFLIVCIDTFFERLTKAIPFLKD